MVTPTSSYASNTLPPSATVPAGAVRGASATAAVNSGDYSAQDFLDFQDATWAQDESFYGSLGGAEAGSQTGGWTFTTTPDDISWSQSAEVSPVKIFGTNQPPVTVGTKGMRELTLGNALVEGFSLGVQVEDKVATLESLMNFSLSSTETGGYVKVPVYRVTANDKVYGSGLSGADGGYFVLKDVKVKETIRDLSGMSTRAFVDISFTQVPPYQVNTGVDQASKTVSGAKSILTTTNEQNAKLAEQIKQNTASTPPAATPPAAATPAVRPARP